MLDPKKLLNDFLGSQIPGAGGTVRERAGQAGQMAKDNPLATGAIAAVLLGTGVGRELTGSALKLGAAAAVGGLAYTAWKNYKEGRQIEQAGAPGQQGQPEVLPPPQGSEFDIEGEGQDGEFALALVRAMIAAAHADGHIDAGERQRIFERVDALPLSGEDKAMLFDELRNPLDLDALVRLVPDGETAVEVYASSLLAVDASQRQAAWYLAELARRLAIPQQLVDAVHQEAGSVQPGGSLHSAA